MNFLPFAIIGYGFTAGSIVIDKILLRHSLPNPLAYTFYISILGLLAVLVIPFGVKFDSTPAAFSILSGVFSTIALYTLFQALKARQVDVQIPNVDGYMDRQEISLCSEEACVSEVTGMMGLEAGLYIGIEENSTSLIFTVNVVDLEGRISNRVAISRTREKLRSIQDSENVANALADVFLQQNH